MFSVLCGSYCIIMSSCSDKREYEVKFNNEVYM